MQINLNRSNKNNLTSSLLIFNSCIDEVVLQYIISVLSELGSGGEDCVDMEQLEDLLLAYAPSVNEIDK